MTSITVTITNKTGLHARPANLFTNEASKYKSKIMVIKDGNEYNAKSIFSVLSMGATPGTELKITADGEDENKAIISLKDFINNLEE